MTTLSTKLITQVLWVLILMAFAVAAQFIRVIYAAKRMEATRDAPARPMTDGRTLFYIVVIISACAAAFLYFRATFPH